MAILTTAWVFYILYKRQFNHTQVQIVQITIMRLQILTSGQLYDNMEGWTCWTNMYLITGSAYYNNEIMYHGIWHHNGSMN